MQYCVSFCCTTKQISHMHTHVSISPPSGASLPSSLSHPSRSSQSTEQISLCYAATSHQPTILQSVTIFVQTQRHGSSKFPKIFISPPRTSCHQIITPLILITATNDRAQSHPLSLPEDFSSRLSLSLPLPLSSFWIISVST